MAIKIDNLSRKEIDFLLNIMAENIGRFYRISDDDMPFITIRSKNSSGYYAEIDSISDSLIRNATNVINFSIGCLKNNFIELVSHEFAHWIQTLKTGDTQCYESFSQKKNCDWDLINEHNKLKKEIIVLFLLN